MSPTLLKRKRSLVAFMAILLFFLIVADVSIVSTYRRQMLSGLKKHWQSELDMTGIFITESLLKHEYANVENFLVMSAKENDNIIEINAVTPNNFVLVQYKRAKPSAHTFPQEKQIRYGDRDLLDLKVVRDFEPEEKNLRNLLLQLIAGSLLVTIIMGFVLWISIRRMALRPLEREITERRHAEELLQRAKNDLEIKVRERTSELRDINENLLLEISERTRVEEDLRESEEKFRNLFNNAEVGMFRTRLDGSEILNMNERFLTIFGRTREEMHGSASVIHWADPREREEMLRRLEAEDYLTEFECGMLTKQGEVRRCLTSLRLYRAQGILEGSIMDITARKRAEEAITRSEARLKDAQRQGKMGDWETDLATNILSWSDEVYAIFGMNPDRSITIRVDDFIKRIHPDDRQRVKDFIKESVDNALDSWNIEYRIILDSGEEKHIFVNALVEKNDQGMPVRRRGIVQDITERKQAEVKYKTILDTAMDSFYIIDAQQGNILEVNDAYCSLIGYSRTELLKMSLRDIEASENPAKIAEHMQFIIKNGSDRFETRHRSKDGRILDLETSVNYMREANKFFVFMHDITERKLAEKEKEKLQAQLLQAQKMEAIGHLAGGVAHDFNNILSAIMGYAHLMLMNMKDDDPLRRNLQQILISSEKAANLTKSLLAFSRKQAVQMQYVNINEIVLGMTKILDRIIGEDIHLRVNTAGHDLMINADVNQIEQVLMNLASNARDAMPDGGTLTVTTGEFEIDEQYIKMHQVGEVGKYAFLSVADTGMGMDDNTKKNIFDPFFSTKEVGKGTGLGLSMIYGTIKQHNGFINVYSKPGEGSAFKIYLPLAKSGKKVTKKKEAAAISSGTETVLLVEDDEAVRNSTKTLLQEFGYSVIEAVDVQQALKLFMENKDIIRLVITDIIMPGQSGKDLHNELMKITAGVKVIFISGYPAYILAKKGIIDSEVNLILKPAKPEVLLSKVREVLDE
ncbi:MAG: PAS domain S-box protein [Nitrospirae bacterium]|nr:PAS domain S-box protein [Nitrospirota bacterium]